MNNRLTSFKGVVLGETGFHSDGAHLLESAGYLFRAVGVGAEGDDLAAKLLEALHDLGAGIGCAIRVIAKNLGVEIKTLAASYQVLKDWINLVLELLIRIILGAAGSVSHYIIYVAKNIIVIKEFQVIQSDIKGP